MAVSLNLGETYAEFARLCADDFPVEDFDPICEALEKYQRKHETGGGRILPNRVVALAVVRLMEEWERQEWARD